MIIKSPFWKFFVHKFEQNLSLHALCVYFFSPAMRVKVNQALEIQAE
jgi:hypothetical protein